jgi:ABC-type multidrug transport system fused ATPase/permease subunit
MWRADKRLTVALAAMIVAGAAFSPLYALTTGQLVGAVRYQRSAVGWLLVLAALYTTAQLLSPARDYVSFSLTRRIDDQVRSRMMAAMLTPNGVAHLEDPALQDKLERARGIGWGMTPGSVVQGIQMLWVARLSSIGSLLLVARFRWWLAAVLLVSSLITLRSKRDNFLNMTQLYSMGTQRLRKSNYFREVALSKDSAKESRVFGLGPWAIERFDTEWLHTMRDVWRERNRGFLVVLGGLSLKAIVTIAAFLYVARTAFDGHMALQEFVVVVQGLMGVAGLSYVLGNPELILEQGTAAIRPALEIEDEIHDHSASRISGEQPADGLPRQAIRFENVSFGYAGRDDLVLEGLDLELRAGESLALVGDNGAGKTTIVKLLTRLYDPVGGRITVDGIPLSDIDPEAWHRRLGAIFQDFGRYALSAAENVGLSAFDQPRDLEALNRVAERSGVRALVESWEHGWDSILNRQFEKGVEASGGEWQRIALARALFAVERGAGVLVLDEPTAQLDVRSEAELYERFLEITRGLTTVVISHRFSTVRRADRIVVLEEGRVLESGSHDELVALGGKYAHMFGLQAARFA